MDKDGEATHLLASGPSRRSTGDWPKTLCEGDLLWVSREAEIVPFMRAPNLAERRFTTIQAVP